ncbi:MAG TPA: FlgD immunoglobulin-like domain containing protein [Candidatus Eisenbacteria bacterium]
MKRGLGGAILALLMALAPAPASPAPGGAKEKEAKDERLSPPFRLDYRALSDVPEQEPNNGPAQATVLGCGNRLRPASIAVATPRDTDWVSFTANAGDVITFGTDADGPTPVGDTRIDILRDDGVTVLGTDDDSGPARYSLLSICVPYTGAYYGRIAAYAAETGTYMAFLACAPSGAPNDQCAGAIRIPCGPFALSGTTANACPDYTLPGGGCTGFFADGRDVVYKVEAFAGDSLYVDYVQATADASIYLVTDCSDPAGTCVAGEDSTLVGGHETLVHKFTAPGTYYLVLDSFGAGTGGPWTATGVLTCVPDEVDAFATAHADLDLVGPWGTETIGLNGSATLSATVRALADGDLDGREQIPAELSALELTGNSLNAGPVTVRLRPAASDPFQRSTGEIEENVNVTPGTLDLPPFTGSGTASVSLGAYVEVELPVLKLVLHNDSPKSVAGIFSHEPPAAGETLSGSGSVPLIRENEQSTPYEIGFTRLTLNPAVLSDTLANSKLLVDLLGPLGLETVTLKGTTALEARLGNVADTDGDGLEQVASGLPALSLSGVSALYGPVHVSLDAAASHALPATSGEIEENVNLAGALLEIPPFSWSGTAASFYDLFFRLDVGGAHYHNHVAKHLGGTVTAVPPAPGDVFRNFVPTTLLGDDENPSAFQARRMIFTPDDVKQDSTERDSFPAARLVMDVRGPWGFDQLVFTGMTRIEVDLGSLADTDGDDLEQAPARITQISLTSPGSLFGHVPGPVTLGLAIAPAPGEIEENVNYTPALLDVPPIAAAGTAACGFDALFQMVIPGSPTIHNELPVHAAAIVRRKPAGPGDTFAFQGSVTMFEGGGVPSGISITGVRLTPETQGGTVQVPEPEVPRVLAVRSLRPNPTAGGTTITLAVPRPAEARVVAYDVNGRAVRTLWSGGLAAGLRSLEWDGRSDRGDRVPGGIYFIRLESEGRVAVQRLAILR